MRVRLTGVSGNGAVQSTCVEGEALFPPKVGKPFTVQGVMSTTDVDLVMGDGMFRTITGSVWRVEVLDETLLAIARRAGRA